MFWSCSCLHWLIICLVLYILQACILSMWYHKHLCYSNTSHVFLFSFKIQPYHSKRWHRILWCPWFWHHMVDTSPFWKAWQFTSPISWKDYFSSLQKEYLTSLIKTNWRKLLRNVVLDKQFLSKIFVLDFHCVLRQICQFWRQMYLWRI